VQVAGATDVNRPVWFVDLSQLGDDRFVGAAVASVLGLSEELGQTVTEAISSWIGDREALLLVDNCEHLIDAAAKVIDSLLRSCRGLCVLATSREPLGVDGERAYRVPSLAYPDETESASSSQAADYASIELLVHRAMDHDPTFEASPSSMPAIASICRRLDGIPLAIELVSGRLSSMSPEEVERRLDDRFQLLTGGSRTALPRQQTLAASIDWSYDLLDPAQQAVLLRASTMSGSFDLMAAEAVCSSDDVSEGEVSRIIGALVERNLVRLERADVASRYRLAETIREYASDKLQRLGAEAVAASRCRHALHFARWLEGRNTPPVWGYVPHTLAYLDERERELVRETSNLITASYHAIVYGAAPDDVLRLAYGAGVALVDVHRYVESVDVFERALSSTPGGSKSLRGQVQRWYATALIYMGRYDDGKAVLESARISSLEAGRLDEVLAVDQNLSFVASLRGSDSVPEIIEGLVRLATESGDDDLIAFARASRGTHPVHFGQEMCLDDLRSAVAHFRRVGLDGDYNSALAWLAGVELEVGDLTAAKLHFEETLLARSSSMAIGHLLAHLSLALIELEQGNVAGAVRRWELAALVIESRSIASYYVFCLLVGALCCEAAGHEELAARLFGTADSLVRVSEEVIEPHEARRRKESIIVLQTALGPDEFERLRLEGEALSFAEAESMAHAALGSVGAAA
jgi:predicted ATPase